MLAGFVGAGKVGFSLGKFMTENGIQVTGYYSRHRESAEEAALFTGSKAYYELEELVSESDAVFLTVPDEAISSTYEQLKAFDIRDKYICHCSGALSASETFPDAAARGALGYSIHPLTPVSDKHSSYRELADSLFCIEGDPERIDVWFDLLSGICKGVKIIDSTCKSRYHAAASIASNLYCALMSMSVGLLEDCGFSQNEALDALSPLVLANASAILRYGPVKALTGPIERGDADTVIRHIDCLEGNPGKALYLEAAEMVLHEAEIKNPQRDYHAMHEVLIRSRSEV